MWEDGGPVVLSHCATGALSTALYAVCPSSVTADAAASYCPLLPNGNSQQEKDNGALSQSQDLPPRDSQDPGPAPQQLYTTAQQKYLSHCWAHREIVALLNGVLAKDRVISVSV